MAHYLVHEGFIPLDKSWITRMVAQDCFRSTPENQYTQGASFLKARYTTVSDDLQAAHRADTGWRENAQRIDAGESGTVYRIWRTAAWNEGREIELVKKGSLAVREIYDSPDVLDMKPEERLKLDRGTSQWETAAYLIGISKRIESPPPKLKLTYDAVSHWEVQRSLREPWKPRHDGTILKQAVSYLRMLHLKERSFAPEHSEDYCFARAFGYMTREEGEARWESLWGHESKRPEEMDESLDEALNTGIIKSRDHRIIFACAMRAMAEGIHPRIRHPSSTGKSWREFLRFLIASPHLKFEEALEPA